MKDNHYESTIIIIILIIVQNGQHLMVTCLP